MNVLWNSPGSDLGTIELVIVPLGGNGFNWGHVPECNWLPPPSCNSHLKNIVHPQCTLQ